MIRKLMLAILFMLQLSILPSWGADTVLIDRLSSSDAEDLNIDIPAEVPPGYHEVMIEISDDAGVVDKKVLTFCKDLNGKIDWASNCPKLEKIYSEEELIPLTQRGEIPSYDPAQEPEKTKDLAVTAFAALAALSVAGAGASGQTPEIVQVRIQEKKIKNLAMAMKANLTLKIKSKMTFHQLAQEI